LERAQSSPEPVCVYDLDLGEWWNGRHASLRSDSRHALYVALRSRCKRCRVMRASHARFRALAVRFLRADEASLDTHSHGRCETILRRMLRIDASGQQARDYRLLCSHPAGELGLRQTELLPSGRQLPHQLAPLELGLVQRREEGIFGGAVFDKFGEEVLRLSPDPPSHRPLRLQE
jgi:hypothetical protein